jgi:hypothetical protein
MIPPVACARRSRARLDDAICIVSFGVLIWLAHFLRFTEFGLYADDHYFVARAIGATPAAYWSSLSPAGLIPTGRPLGGESYRLSSAARVVASGGVRLSALELLYINEVRDAEKPP